jgi:hypothetical protein
MCIFRGLPQSFCRAASIVFGVVVMMAAASAAIAAPSSLPTSAPAPVPTTEPAVILPDIAAAVQRVDAGDVSVAPKIVLSLGSERDGLRIGKGSSRLRLCFATVPRLQIKQAVPWLIAIYDDPTADVPTWNRALEAAIGVDPYYSIDFLREVLDDDLLRIGSAEALSPAQRLAAGALATAGDEHARTLLMDAFVSYLDSLNRGFPVTGPKAHNFLSSAQMSRLADPVLLARVAQLKNHFPREPAAKMLNEMIEQMRANLLPAEELLRIAGSDDPADLPRRGTAIIALGNIGGAEAIPVIQKTQVALEARQSKLENRPAASTRPAQTQPSDSTRPASRPAVEPATQPMSEAAMINDALNDCKYALRVLRDRNPVPLPVQIRSAATTQPAVMPGQDKVSDDAPLILPESMFIRPSNGMAAHFLSAYDPAGVLPARQLLFKNDDLYTAMHRIPYGSLIRATIGEDGIELRGLRMVDHAPGEASRDGYVFIKRQTLKDGKWEHLAVVLSKFGHEITLRIPNRRHDDGRYLPDKQMNAVAEALKPGDSVEAVADSGPGDPMLRFLIPYRPPIPARMQKLTSIEGRPAAELLIARKHFTYLLPDPHGAYPTLDDQTLSVLPAGAEVKVVIDQSITPPALLAIRLNGTIAQREDGSIVGIRVGRVAFTAQRSNNYSGGWSITGPRDPELLHLWRGLGRVLNDRSMPARFPADKVAALRQAQQTSAFSLNPADTPLLQSLIIRWLAADAADRPELEKQMELRLVQISAEMSTRQSSARDQIKALLTAREYRELLAPPPPTSKPARPATQPTTVPKTQ